MGDAGRVTEPGGDAAGVPVKMYVERRKRPSVHRVGGVRTFGELVGIVRELRGAGRPVVVQYEDEERDRITVTTAREWEEAVRLYVLAARRAGGGEAPLKLFVPRTGGGRCAGRGAPCAVPTDDDETEEARCCVAATPEASEAGGEAARHFTRAMDGHVLALLSALYECDVARELLRVEPRVEFGEVLRRSYDAASGRVEVEVLLGELGGAVTAAAMTLLDQLETERAAELLGLACVVFPGDATMRYNAGCAHAMGGRREAAMAALEEAARLGYGDADRMERDPDLASVHGEGRFRALVDSLRGSAGSAVQRPSARAAVAVAAPTAAAEVQTLRSVFPALGEADAAAVLQRCGGSVQAAVDAVLGGA